MRLCRLRLLFCSSGRLSQANELDEAIIATIQKGWAVYEGEWN